MKKFILLAGLVILVFTVSQSKATISREKNHFSISFVADSAWTRGTDWTGMSGGKKFYYKINPKNQVIFGSVNMKTWSAVVGGVWMSKDGKKMKISEKKLVWSADNGVTWTEVPDWTWQNADGDWCKFDPEWTLWTKKGEKK